MAEIEFDRSFVLLISGRHKKYIGNMVCEYVTHRGEIQNQTTVKRNILSDMISAYHFSQFVGIYENAIDANFNIDFEQGTTEICVEFVKK